MSDPRGTHAETSPTPATANPQPLLTGVKQGGAGRGGTAPPKEHQFKPGQSGNPSGRPRQMLSKLLSELLAAEDQKYAKVVVKAWLQLACQGNHTALKELLDRVDGARQSRTPAEGEA